MTKRRFTLLLAVAACVAACVRREYRFERIEGTQTLAMPLKFDSLSGIRDGDSVKAELRFAAGADAARVRLLLHLGPPAQFRSGVYRVSIDGRTSEGMVTCDSLTYLGGQGDVPSIGGTFILNDAENRPAYRIVMPPTPMERRIQF